MPVAFATGTAKAGADNPTNTVYTAPSGIANGDLLLIWHFEFEGAAAGPTPTPPTGFTAAPGTWPMTKSEGTATWSAWLWYKIASSESGNYTVTHAQATYTAGLMARVTGADPVTPIQTATQNATDNTGTTTTFTGLTTTQAGELVLAFQFDDGDNTATLSGPSGTTPTFTAAVQTTGQYLAAGVLASAGTTGSPTMANNGAADSPWGAALVAVNPASGGGGGGSTIAGASSVAIDMNVTSRASVLSAGPAIQGSSSVAIDMTVATAGTVISTPPAGGGTLKYWDGTAWTAGTLKAWDGSAWTAATIGSESSDFTVPAAPSGPDAPTSGDWVVAFADAFNQAHDLSTAWYPNRGTDVGGTTYAADDDVPGFNSNEVQVFNSSQVSLDADDGLVLTAESISETKSTSAYRSGCVTTEDNGQDNPFHWKPAIGSRIVIEGRFLMPTLGGSDLGWWTDTFFTTASSGTTKSGKMEIDLFEQFGWSNSGGGGEIAVGNWFGTNKDDDAFQAGREYYPKDNDTVDLQGSWHVWTSEFDGTADTPVLNTYLDGVLMSSVENQYDSFHVTTAETPFPTGWVDDVWENLTLSHALRDTSVTGFTPPYDGTTTSLAQCSRVCVYVDGTLADVVDQEAFIAPGTTVAS